MRTSSSRHAQSECRGGIRHASPLRGRQSYDLTRPVKYAAPPHEMSRPVGSLGVPGTGVDNVVDFVDSDRRQAPGEGRGGEGREGNTRTGASASTSTVHEGIIEFRIRGRRIVPPSWRELEVDTSTNEIRAQRAHITDKC